MEIALIASETKRELMVQFCIAYCGVLAKHNICAPKMTGRFVAEATGLPIEELLPDSEGGLQQIASRITYDEVTSRPRPTSQRQKRSSPHSIAATSIGETSSIRNPNTTTQRKQKYNFKIKHREFFQILGVFVYYMISISAQCTVAFPSEIPISMTETGGSVPSFSKV